jgi:hypothetical protein
MSGALPHRDYLQLIKEAGFEDVGVVETKPIELPDDVLAAHMDAKRSDRGAAIRVEAPNGLDRLTDDIDDNRFDRFSVDDFVRARKRRRGPASSCGRCRLRPASFRPAPAPASPASTCAATSRCDRC